VCGVTEPVVVGLCWAAATLSFDAVTALPATLALLAAVVGVVVWAGLARFPPIDPGLRILRSLWVLFGCGLLALCTYAGVASAAPENVAGSDAALLLVMALLATAWQLMRDAPHLPASDSAARETQTVVSYRCSERRRRMCSGSFRSVRASR
jgi:hypothetical protein